MHRLLYDRSAQQFVVTRAIEKLGTDLRRSAVGDREHRDKPDAASDCAFEKRRLVRV